MQDVDQQFIIQVMMKKKKKRANVRFVSNNIELGRRSLEFFPVGIFSILDVCIPHHERNLIRLVNKVSSELSKVY